MSKKRFTRPVQSPSAPAADALTEEFEEYANGEYDDGDLLVRHGLAVELVSDAGARERWVIVRTRNDRVTYAGKALAWSPSRHSGVAFETRMQAVVAAESFADACERFATEPEYAVTQTSVRVPMVPDGRSRSFPLRLSVVLDLEESQAVECLRKALRQLNAEVRPGKPVFSNADAIRWLLSQIPQDASDQRTS